MLTQRTIARFQRFLSGLMHYNFYGMDGIAPALSVGNYYNKLYESDLPRPLLDVLGRRTAFEPVPMTLALFEGQAVAEANNSSYVLDKHRQIGTAYLLCFMAVALRFYERLAWDRRSVFQSEAQEFIDSLRADGFSYDAGEIRELASGELIFPVPLEGKPPRAVVPAEVSPPESDASIPQPEAAIATSPDGAIEELAPASHTCFEMLDG